MIITNQMLIKTISVFYSPTKLAKHFFFKFSVLIKV